MWLREPATEVLINTIILTRTRYFRHAFPLHVIICYIYIILQKSTSNFTRNVIAQSAQWQDCRMEYWGIRVCSRERQEVSFFLHFHGLHIISGGHAAFSPTYTGALSCSVKWLRREGQHSPPFIIDVNECMDLWLHFSTRLHDVPHRKHITSPLQNPTG
jgi:hypothetical protein